MRNLVNTLHRGILTGLIVLFFLPFAALASPIHVTVLKPGVQDPSDFTNYFETFDSGFSGTTNFNGSPVTGTFSSNYTIYNADQFGGAGGVGKFLGVAIGDSMTVTLSQGVNYLGLWFSALDAGNQIDFYNNNQLLFTFTPQLFIDGVGQCPGSAWCGNPNPNFLGMNGSQQYAYLNFYDATGTFNKVVFSESCCGRFESDNYSLANLATDPGGTEITPEPASLVMFGSGLLGLVGLLRRIPS